MLQWTFSTARAAERDEVRTEFETGYRVKVPESQAKALDSVEAQASFKAICDA